MDWFDSYEGDFGRFENGLDRLAWVWRSARSPNKCGTIAGTDTINDRCGWAVLCTPDEPVESS